MSAASALGAATAGADGAGAGPSGDGAGGAAVPIGAEMADVKAKIAAVEGKIAVVEAEIVLLKNPDERIAELEGSRDTLTPREKGELRNLRRFLGIGDKAQAEQLAGLQQQLAGLQQQLAGLQQQLAELQGTLRELQHKENLLLEKEARLEAGELSSGAAADGDEIAATLEGVRVLLQRTDPENHTEQASSLSALTMEPLATTSLDDVALFFTRYSRGEGGQEHHAPGAAAIVELSSKCLPCPETGRGKNVQEFVAQFFDETAPSPEGSAHRREANVKCDRTHHGGDDTNYTPSARGYVDHVWIPSGSACSYVARGAESIGCPVLGLCEDKCGLGRDEPDQRAWHRAIPQFKAYLLAAIEMNLRRDPPVRFAVPGALTNGTLWRFGCIFDSGAIFKVALTRCLDAREGEDAELIARGVAWLHGLVARNARLWETALRAPREDGEDGVAGGGARSEAGSSGRGDAEGGGGSDCENHGGGPSGKAMGGGGAVPQGSRPQGAGGYTAQLSTAALATRNRCAPTRPPNPVDRFWPPFPRVWE